MALGLSMGKTNYENINKNNKYSNYFFSYNCNSDYWKNNDWKSFQKKI